MKRRVSVILSYEMLRGLLHLREDLQITGVERRASTESVEIFVSGPNLPEVQRRAQITRVSLATLMDYEVQP